MKRLHSFKLVALLSVVAGSLNAYLGSEGPLERGRWYVMPKIGVAPGIFANRGHERVVVPVLAIPEDCEGQPCRQAATNLEGTVLESQCKIPKFNDAWSNGVLHVGGEMGHNVSDNGQLYLEAYYNRASGDCLCTQNDYVVAPDGCNSSDCDNDCRPRGNVVFSAPERRDDYENYASYGGYLGYRHYFGRMWCDSLAFFTGLKFGIQHRKQVCVCTTVPEYTKAETTFAERTFSNIAVCKSNAVSGGLQIGADYCWNECMSMLVGIELQVTSPFKLNRNVKVSPVTSDNRGQIPQITNIVGCGTGTFVQFPVWAGLRWEFDWCNPCDPCA